MSTSGPASVTFRSVVKRYGGVTAVDAVSFAIEAGNLVTLLGPSGCGKTTMLRLIAGLEMPTSGQILIGVADVTRLSASSRNVSMVFQSYALFPHMSVLDNVSYGLKMSGFPKAEVLTKAEDGLALVGLEGLARRMPSELSGGQQQRVAVARALVLEPEVLLFDEPLSNLDAKLRRRVREDIRELQQRLRLTTVYVTHDQEEALAVSDRIIVMRNAAIAQEGTPHELYEAPAHRFVADFIGDSNLVEGEIVRTEGDAAVIRLGAIEVRRPRRGMGPGPATVAIRPDAIRLSERAEDGLLAGSVLKATYLGSHMEYRVDCPLGELFVIDHRVDTPLARGANVSIALAERGVNLVSGAP